MPNFTAGSKLLAQQLNDAFAQYLPLGSVSAFTLSLLGSGGLTSWLTGLGLPTASPGTANGLATLGSDGKILMTQLPASVTGSMHYVGSWNASTNSPTIVSGVGAQGAFYKVSVAGTTNIDGQAMWGVGDIIAFDGTVWDRFDGGATEVFSVAGLVGDITASGLRSALNLVIGTSVQQFSLLLNAIDGVGGNGLIAKTAGATVSTRTITAGANKGIVIANGDGVSGNPTISGDLATAIQYITQTAYKLLSADIVWAAVAPVTVAYASSLTLDFNAGINFIAGTMTANTTINNPTGTIKPGQCGFIKLNQGTGGFTLTFGSYWNPISGSVITPPTAANATVIIQYQVISATEISYNIVRGST